MKIKTKLHLGFSFLFLMMLFFGAFAGYCLKDIADSSKVILRDNYETLNILKELRRIVDNQDLPLSKISADRLEMLLKKQEKNITEKGEADLTALIRRDFELLKTNTSNDTEQRGVIRDLRNNITQIEELNMRAIVRKNDRAQNSVKEANLYLQIIGSFIIIILFSFIVNIPGFIADPLFELLEGIKEISRKNYQARLDFPKNNEFAPVATAFNQMAAKLRDWENSNLEKILSEKLRIETIIEQMQDGIIGLNEKNEIIFINPLAQNLLGIHGNEMIGLNAYELANTNELLKNLLDNKQSEKAIKIYANGRESYFQLESREIMIPSTQYNEDKPILTSSESAGEVYILKNITKFRELEDAKTNFIATISHELKTPISSIKLSLNLLTDSRVGRLNTEQLSLLENIKDDTLRLLKITSELLDMAQVETGNIHLNFIATKPDQIVDYAINSIKFQADQQHIQIECISQPGLPRVYADVEKTTWVLINLLSNALRYSPEKSKIIVQISQSIDMVEFSVKDFGNGIEEQYQARLFERFFQVPTEGKRSGTGLGLSISKDFIEAQKGVIFVESRPGSGSRFGFKLPIAH